MRTVKLPIFNIMIGLALLIVITACSDSQKLQSNSSPSPETSPKAVEKTPEEKSVDSSSLEIDFSKVVKNASLKGFSSQEDWGRWTDSKQASITFNQALPNSFEVVINGSAFGPNINQDITLIIGSQQRKFRLGADKKEVKLEFKGIPANVRMITFAIPKPTSPKQLGQKDERKLGIGLRTLKID